MDKFWFSDARTESPSCRFPFSTLKSELFIVISNIKIMKHFVHVDKFMKGFMKFQSCI